MSADTTVCAPQDNCIKIIKWKVREGFQVTNNQLILLYELVDSEDKEVKRLKAINSGVVKKRLRKDGDIVPKGYVCLSFMNRKARDVTLHSAYANLSNLSEIRCWSCQHVCTRLLLRTCVLTVEQICGKMTT